jgi:drug/metabolite transporter (DMT)-like permease
MRGQTGYLVLLFVISIVNSASQILTRWGGLQSVRSTTSTTGVWHWLWISRWWVSGVVMGWTAGLGWAWCLRRLPLGMAIPLFVGLVYVLSLVGGAFLLREKLSALQLLGAAAILVGVVLVTLSSASPPGTVDLQ